MKTKQDLRDLLNQIDHKSYGSYKVLKGIYNMGNWILYIDHVQGDPFAAPSRIRIGVSNKGNFPIENYQEKHRRIALEDWLLRKLHESIRYVNSGCKGSGKSGMITTCRIGQEVLERIAIKVTKQDVQARLEVGFPAFGRTIASKELEKIICHALSQITEQTFFYKSLNHKFIQETMELADDQLAARKILEEKGLCAFIADGSILPRESGISEKPMKGAVSFISPESQALTINLPHRGNIRGMGIRKGITIIVGGGYHGKSTMLKAVEAGVYNHKIGDGRELVITDDTAVKLRAEEGRCIHDTDISMFINNLPNKADTMHFNTENASGSTSQAANTVEAVSMESSLFLIDEDTSATNFMVRDETMAALVRAEKEPITPFLQCVKSLSEDWGISSVIVVGSSGAFLSVADTVLQMDNYETKDVTSKAKKLVQPVCHKEIAIVPFVHAAVVKQNISKIRVHGWDSLSFDKSEIDLRYLEQLVDEGQTAAIGYFMQYALNELADNEKNPVELAKEVMIQIEKKGFEAIVPAGYSAGSPVMPRLQELAAGLERYRFLVKKSPKVRPRRR